MIEPRRIVTGVLPDGTSGIVTDEKAAAVSPSALTGLDFFMLWGTDEGRSLDSRPGSGMPYWPGPGGTRFLIVRWSPASDAPGADGGATVLNGDAEHLLPGLTGAFEPENPGFHTSDSIDYGVCLEGEMWLQLDGEHGARITTGTCVVQRGTRHAWQNRSSESALMLFVLVGADRARI